MYVSSLLPSHPTLLRTFTFTFNFTFNFTFAFTFTFTFTFTFNFTFTFAFTFNFAFAFAFTFFSRLRKLRAKVITIVRRMVATLLAYDDYKDLLQSFVAYIVLYYLFLYLQSLAAFYVFFQKRRDEKSDEKISFAKIKYYSSDKLSLTTQRSVGNTLEQSVPFLTGLLLHTLFVSPSSASKLCWWYVATRAPYPIAFYYGAPFLSTIPGYLVVLCLFVKIFYPNLVVPLLLS